MAVSFTGTTESVALSDIVWADTLGLFVVSRSTGSTDRIITSPDGNTWTTRTTPNQSLLYVSWDTTAALLIGVGTGTLASSTDGVKWTVGTAPDAYNWFQAAYSPSLGLWAITGGDGTQRIATSSSGTGDWTLRTTPNATFRHIVWSPDLAVFVAIDAVGSGIASVSSDGITWSTETIDAYAWDDLYWDSNNQRFLAFAGVRIATSPDGAAWTDYAYSGSHTAGYQNCFNWLNDQSLGVTLGSSASGGTSYAISSNATSWGTETTLDVPYDAAFQVKASAYSPELSRVVFINSNNAQSYQFLIATVTADGTNDTFWYQSDVPGLEAGVDATIVYGASARPKGPRGNVFTSPFSESNPLFGFPGHAVAFNNRMLYAAGDYTVGTDLPTIRVWNGTSDYLLATVPKDGSGNIPKCVTTMVNGDGAIYLGTWDTGTASSNVVGRVLKLDPNSGQLTNIGNMNTLTGYIPWALQFHNGELWAGMHRSDTSAGRIYRIRPSRQTSWTLSRDLSADSVGPCTVITAFQGKMYFGSAAAGGTFAKLGSRNSYGAYSLLYTGTGGTAQNYNGFYAATVFDDKLYFSYWNPDATEVSLIKKYDGTTVSTAYTVTAVANVPIISLFVHDGVLYALGVRRSGGAYTSVLLTTPDGTTWTNRTADLPTTEFTSTGVANAVASIAY